MIELSITKQEILDKIEDLPYQSKLDFIKNIDNNTQDWAFTEDCFKYFAEEILSYLNDDSFCHSALKSVLLEMEQGLCKLEANWEELTSTRLKKGTLLSPCCKVNEESVELHFHQICGLRLLNQDGFYTARCPECYSMYEVSK